MARPTRAFLATKLVQADTKRRELPILVVDPHGAAPDLQGTLEAEVTATLTKPYTTEGVLSVTDKVWTMLTTSS